jgi:hypothetical protein
MLRLQDEEPLLSESVNLSIYTTEDRGRFAKEGVAALSTVRFALTKNQRHTKMPGQDMLVESFNAVLSRQVHADRSLNAVEFEEVFQGGQVEREEELSGRDER